MKFKDYFRSSRKAAKLTQQQIADRFGIERVSVSNWERGQNLPDPKRIPALASILGVPVSKLMSVAYPNDETSNGNSSLATDRNLISPPPPSPAYPPICDELIAALSKLRPRRRDALIAQILDEADQADTGDPPVEKRRRRA